MTDDRRARARDLIAAQLHATDRGRADFPPEGVDVYYRRLADGLMELFPDVWRQRWAAGSCYVLRTAPKPDGDADDIR